MAGIGFELKKLFRKRGFFRTFRGIIYASMTTIGPILLVVTVLIGINWIMHYFGSSYTEQELLATAILYAFVFSLIISTIVNTIISRYISDKIFEEKEEDILPSVYGSLVFTLSIAAVIGIPFHVFAYIATGLSIWFLLGSYTLFILLTSVFVLMNYVSAIKEYGKITMAFFFGLLSTFITASILIFLMDISLTNSILYGMVMGFLIIDAKIFAVIRRFFRTDSGKYFEFLNYFRKYFYLLISGFFYVLGLYIHNFLFWFSELGITVCKVYRCAPSYDMATFVAMLTNIPALVIFVVKVETSFHDKYQRYCAAVIGGGYKEIKSARVDMTRTLTNELFFIIEIQLIITLVLTCTGIAVFPVLGFAGLMLDLYPLLSLGFYAVFMMYFLMVFLYYFDDRKGAAGVSILFFIVTTAATALSMFIGSEFFGTGLLIGGVIGWIAAFARLRVFLRELDYHMFCDDVSIGFLGKSAA